MREHVAHLIELYLDEELQGEERRHVEAHLAQCAECRARLERERRFMALLAHARPLYEVPESVRARVERTWARAQRARPRPWSWALGLAALLLIGLVLRSALRDRVLPPAADRVRHGSEFALLL